MSERCRLCSANDRDAMIEDLAAELWMRHRGRTDGASWEEAGGYWQIAFRGIASDAIDLLRRP